MTKERRTQENPAETDAVVTQVYRDTADEHAPETLNRAILRHAAKAARPRYSRLIFWTRPMAWAATVMLSVAIVLQLTQVPVPESASFEDDTQAVEAAADTPVERLEESVRPEAEAGRDSADVTAERPKIEALRSTAKQVAPNAPAERRQRSDQSKAVVLEQEAALANEVPQTVSAERATLGLVSAAFETPGCNESVTAAAETWLQCIAELEEAGLNDTAREQRKLFTAAFPDFDTP